MHTISRLLIFQIHTVEDRSQRAEGDRNTVTELGSCIFFQVAYDGYEDERIHTACKRGEEEGHEDALRPEQAADPPGQHRQTRAVLAVERDADARGQGRHEPAVVLQDLGLPPDAEGVSEGFATLLVALGLNQSDLKGKTIVAYESGFIDWLKPQYDSPIEAPK